MNKEAELDARFKQVWDWLDKMYHVCYSDDSNELYDELHDDLLYQRDGFLETWDEWEAVSEEGATHTDLAAYHSELNGVDKMLDQIVGYYNLTKSMSDNNIDWMYG